jgi:starch phosphorylase
MDSMATLKIPAVGYGLRYDYGIFSQRIENGYQVEEPELWLKHGYPWEIAHPEYSFEVRFGGHVETRQGPRGSEWKWVDAKPVIGMPYDFPVVGYGGEAVNTLRLGHATPPKSSTWRTSIAAPTLRP